MLKKVIIALLLSIVVLMVFIYGLGSILAGKNGEIIILTLSIHFTIILCTLIILEKLNKKWDKKRLEFTLMALIFSCFYRTIYFKVNYFEW